MQQWVKIKYPGDREVLMDGKPFGPTNRNLPVNEGTHTFTLEGPADYEPPFDKRLIADSSEEFPIEIEFRRLHGIS